MIAGLVFIQMISCGMFFCVSVPFGHRSYVDYRELLTDAGLVLQQVLPAPKTIDEFTTPKLIPRVLHQTYRSKYLPKAAKKLVQTWREKNGENWQIRFYDDAACLNFVKREFPEYLEAYLSLPKDVERADFFR
jgi:mannosyltransferase OCH1-like enzyme